MLLPSGGNGNVTALVDPFANAYGYSTAYRSPDPNTGFNPTFDSWSPAAGTTTGDIPKWIKNWSAYRRLTQTPYNFAGLSPSLRLCAPRLRRADSDFALRLSRSRTRGISLHRIRASGFAPG